MRYIEQWCDAAVSYIRFPPDRPPVRQELLEHMQDKYDGYIQESMAPAQAESRVTKEMGEARETGLLLRKIHKPYLGWVWRATQWVLVIALILAVYNGVQWARDLYISDGPPLLGAKNWYETTTYEYDRGSSERVLYLEPNCSDRSDGYTFTVTKVAYWEGTYTDEDGTRDINSFYFLLEVTNPRPWAGYTDAPRWFYAVDSLGNYYDSCYEYDGESPALRGNAAQTGLFTDTWNIWATSYVSQDADWLELRYDRDGRDISLRIDLTGGEGA